MIFKILVILKRLLLPLCLLYVIFIVVSFFASQVFPEPFNIETIQTNRDTTCHWVNALVLSIECGEKVFAGDILEFFYNFWIFVWFIPTMTKYAWTTLLFSPEHIGELGSNPFADILILTIQASLIVAPFLYLAWRSLHSIRHVLSNRKHEQ